MFLLMSRPATYNRGEWRNDGYSDNEADLKARLAEYLEADKAFNLTREYAIVKMVHRVNTY